MSENKKQDNRQPRDDKKKNVTNTGRPDETASDRSTNDVNRGNPTTNTDRGRSNRELHTKTGVTGSDSDGQAD